MARIRTIKPEFFKHEGLFDLEKETGLPIRVAFAGLWTECDRDGRFEWRPRRLKAAVLPYDELDFSRVLDALATRGFLVRYACPEAPDDESRDFGMIPSWNLHQIPNNREKESTIPPPSDACPTRAPRVPHATSVEREGKGNGVREGSRLSSSAASRASRKTLIPDDFESNDTHLAIAQTEGLKLLEQELAFVQHAKMTGRKLADWNLGFCVWLRKAKDFARSNGPPGIPRISAAQARQDATMQAGREVIAALRERGLA